MLLPLLDGGYYFYIIPLYVDNYHKFLHNFRYPQTSVANNIIVISPEISFQLWHGPQSDYHEVLVITESLGNFESLLLFIFPFSIGAHYEVSSYSKKLLFLFTILFFKW